MFTIIRLVFHEQIFDICFEWKILLRYAEKQYHKIVSKYVSNFTKKLPAHQVLPLTEYILKASYRTSAIRVSKIF